MTIQSLVRMSSQCLRWEQLSLSSLSIQSSSRDLLSCLLKLGRIKRLLAGIIPILLLDLGCPTQMCKLSNLLRICSRELLLSSLIQSSLLRVVLIWMPSVVFHKTSWLNSG